MHILTHQNEWPLYQYLEDEFNCSGICRPALFYFSNPISFGPPKNTCLKQVVTLFKNDAQPFAMMSIVTAVLFIVVFCLHFCLYDRPLDERDKLSLDDFRVKI